MATVWLANLCEAKPVRPLAARDIDIDTVGLLIGPQGAALPDIQLYSENHGDDSRFGSTRLTINAALFPKHLLSFSGIIGWRGSELADIGANLDALETGDSAHDCCRRDDRG